MQPDFAPLAIGITGGSASGKTTFARELVRELEEYRPVLLNQDRYFRDWMDLPEAEREQARTANSPRAVLWEELVGHIKELIRRQPIHGPVRGTRAWHREPEKWTQEAGDLVVVEGHLILWDETLRALMDIKVFMDADPHERVLRRMLRDTARGGMDLEQAVAWYRRDVVPNFPVYTEPTRRFADLVVPFDDDNPTAVRVIASGVRDILEGRRKGKA